MHGRHIKSLYRETMNKIFTYSWEIVKRTDLQVVNVLARTRIGK